MMTFNRVMSILWLVLGMFSLYAVSSDVPNNIVLGMLAFSMSIQYSLHHEKD